MVSGQVELIQLEEHQLFTLNRVTKTKKTENARVGADLRPSESSHTAGRCVHFHNSHKRKLLVALSDHTHTLGS